MTESTQNIVDQLLVFGVGTKQEILNAINKVVNNTDINEIIDYIKNNQNDNNEESKQDEFNKYVKIVKELDEKRIHKTLNVLDYLDEKYNGIPAYIHLIVSFDTSHFNVNTISKDIKQTFDGTKEDPFDYFSEHWKEYNDKKKLQMHTQITETTTLFLEVHGGSDDSFANETELKELAEIGKKFDVLNNLERKVYLLKYFCTVGTDIRKLQKYDSFFNRFGYQMFDSPKEIIKFNNAANGDWYQDENNEWKYAKTQYIFKYNITNDDIRTQYRYYVDSGTQIITENDNYCIIKAMDNESKVDMSIKIIFKTDTNGQKIYETEVDILNKANHKNIIKLVNNIEDDSNYYIVTKYYKKRGLLQCINKVTPDIELKEKIAAACIKDVLSLLQCCSIKQLNVEQFEIRTDNNEKRDLVLTDYHSLISFNDTRNIEFIYKQLGQMTYKIIIGKDIEMDEKNEFEIDIPNSIELKYLSQEFEDFILMLLNKKCSIEYILKHNWLKKADYNPVLFPAKHGLWIFLNFIQGLVNISQTIRMQSYLKIFKIDDNKLGIYDFFLSEGNKKERKSFNSGFYIYYIRENKWQISAPLEMDCGDSFWNEFNHTKLCPMISKYNKLTNILTIYEDFTQKLVEYDVQNDIWNVNKYKKRLLSKISSGGSSGSGDWFRYDATPQNGILINDIVHTFVGDQFAKNYKHFVCDMFGNAKRKEIQTDNELKALKKNYKCNFIDSLGEMVYCSLKNCLYVISGKGGIIYKYSLTESKWYNVSDKKCEGDQLKGVSCYNGEYILFFGGYKSESSTTGNIYIYVLNVETEKLIKSNVRLPFYDGIYCGITKNECDIIGGDKTLFLDGIARMHYGYVVKIADSIIDLIYEYMSIEYLYMITQKGNLCKIAVNEIIFSNETIYIPRQDSIQSDNNGCLIQ